MPSGVSGLRVRVLSRLRVGAFGFASLLLGLALLLVAVADSAFGDTFAIGYREDAPPFAARAETVELLPPGWGAAYDGFAVDICREVVDAVTKQTGAEFTEFPVNAGNRFKIESGNDPAFDMLCDTTSISRDRLKYCSFTFPYFVTSISFATAGDVPPISEVKGRKIGLVGGTTAEERLRTEWSNRFGETPTIMRFEDYTEAVAAVADGTLEVLFGDQVLLEKAAENASIPVNVSSDIISTEVYSFCINPEQPELLRIANRTLAELYSGRRIYDLLSRHFAGRGASRLLLMLYTFYAVPEN